MKDFDELREYKKKSIEMIAYPLKGDREKCLECGMDDYITKPIDFGEVLDKIRKYVRETEKGTE